MNAHQRRLTRRECMRTMKPGTEVLLRSRRGRHATAVVLEAAPSRVPRVKLAQYFDYGHQSHVAWVRFTNILGYRRPA